MKRVSTSVKKSTTTRNIILGVAVFAAAIAGYFLLTGKKSTALPNGNNTSGGSSSPNDFVLPGGSSPSSPGGVLITPSKCTASAGEFPLTKGAGYSARANGKCEKEYVKNIQRFLNKYLPGMGLSTLTEDGGWGDKTDEALGYYFGRFWNNMITLESYHNILND